MKACVVDASVAAKWVMEDAYSIEALRLLDGRALCAPAHWLGEAVNALWGAVLRGVIPASQASAGATVLMRVPVAQIALDTLMRDALELSILHTITIYDSLYVTLARGRGIPFVTDDRRLVRKLGALAVPAAHLVWLGDLA